MTLGSSRYASAGLPVQATKRPRGEDRCPGPAKPIPKQRPRPLLTHADVRRKPCKRPWIAGTTAATASPSPTTDTAHPTDAAYLRIRRNVSHECQPEPGA